MIRRRARADAPARVRRLAPRLAQAVGIAAVALIATGATPRAAWAHDVPNEIIVRGFVKPEGDRLKVAVRVPLILLSQLDLPKRGPGYLALDRINPALDRAAVKISSELIRFSEGNDLLAPVAIDHRVSLPSEKAFENYDDAIRHIRSQDLSRDTDVFWNQGFFDAYLAFPIRSGSTDLYVDPIPPSGVGDKMEMLIQYIPSDGAIRTYRLAGDSEAVALDPSWFHAARTFVESGVEHILGGLDHLLFLLCLVFPIRDLRRLLPVVTSFTVAHSIALVASAYGVVPSGEWFPPLVEALIAGSIVYMAVENIISPEVRRRWIITGAFGVVHGFGFSFGLQQDFQLAGDHLLTSLFSFNVGVEIGQVFVLAMTVPLLALLFRIPTLSRFGVILGSVIIGHTGWHWMTDRIAVLPSLEWPAVSGTSVAVAARGLVIVMLIAGAAHWYGRRKRDTARKAPLEPKPRAVTDPRT